MTMHSGYGRKAKRDFRDAAPTTNQTIIKRLADINQIVTSILDDLEEFVDLPCNGYWSRKELSDDKLETDDPDDPDIRSDLYRLHRSVSQIRLNMANQTLSNPP